MKSKKDYISMLNDLGNSLSREEWIIGGKDRYTGRDNYGVMLKRYDPIAFEVGYNEWKKQPQEIKRFLEAAEGYPVDVDLETQGFYRCNDAGTLPGECADFIFHKCND